MNDVFLLTYSKHEPLQLICPGPVPLHDCSDLGKGCEPHDEKDESNGEVDSRGDDDQVKEAGVVKQTHVAHPGKHVAWNRIMLSNSRLLFHISKKVQLTIR